MIKLIAKWSIKSWLIDLINEALAKYKDNVQAALAIVDKAIAKVEAVLAYLKSLREKLADNKITDDEADAAIAEGQKLIEDLFK